MKLKTKTSVYDYLPARKETTLIQVKINPALAMRLRKEKRRLHFKYVEIFEAMIQNFLDGSRER